MRIRFDDQTYNVPEVEGLRKELISWRDASLQEWPDAIPITVGLSHVIAILGIVAEHMATCPSERLDELINRHTSDTGEHPVAVAELRKLRDPALSVMKPATPGHVATCSICWPDGDL
jgi:hypothetical protein